MVVRRDRVPYYSFCILKRLPLLRKRFSTRTIYTMKKKQRNKRKQVRKRNNNYKEKPAQENEDYKDTFKINQALRTRNFGLLREIGRDSGFLSDAIRRRVW